MTLSSNYVKEQTKSPRNDSPNYNEPIDELPAAATKESTPSDSKVSQLGYTDINGMNNNSNNTAGLPAPMERKTTVILSKKEQQQISPVDEGVSTTQLEDLDTTIE
jgi:hypothetical protein